MTNVIIDFDNDGHLSRLWELLPYNLVSIDQLQAALRAYARPAADVAEEVLSMHRFHRGKHYVYCIGCTWSSPSDERSEHDAHVVDMLQREGLVND